MKIFTCKFCNGKDVVLLEQKYYCNICKVYDPVMTSCAELSQSEVILLCKKCTLPEYLYVVTFENYINNIRNKLCAICYAENKENIVRAYEKKQQIYERSIRTKIVIDVYLVILFMYLNNDYFDVLLLFIDFLATGFCLKRMIYKMLLFWKFSNTNLKMLMPVYSLYKLFKYKEVKITFTVQTKIDYDDLVTKINNIKL